MDSKFWIPDPLPHAPLFLYMLVSMAHNTLQYPSLSQEVSKLSNMMEDLYRHDMLSTEGPPWNRDQVVDQAALLKQKLEDVMQGFTVDEEA